jgi:hypothetical protein
MLQRGFLLHLWPPWDIKITLPPCAKIASIVVFVRFE